MNSSILKTVELAASPELALSDISRFETAYTAKLHTEFSWDSTNAHQISHIFGNSNILVQQLINNPEWASQIAESPYLDRIKPIDAMMNDLTGMIRVRSFDGCASAIRRFKYKELIRIAIKDLSRSTPVRDILAEWSSVADAIVEVAMGITSSIIDKELVSSGVVRNPDTKGCIIALGKLGSCELNISSDIDLLIIYDEDGSPESTDHRPISNHEYWVRFTTVFTKLISTSTPDGFAFRVDHDLRPEGGQGPLANSLDAAVRYYEYFGHDWERQALMRARPIAGDKDLGSKFITSVRPFIFRKSISICNLMQMRELKDRVQKEATEFRSGSSDIKHGSGGIREVEFFVQALQLLHGGRRAALREPNTFAAIDALAAEGLIHHNTAAVLSDAYSFLRRTENMIQIENDAQLHRIPQDPDQLAKLIRRLGYTEPNFKIAISGHQLLIEKIFNALFEADYQFAELEEAMNTNLAACADEEEISDSLAWFKVQETKRIAALDLAGMLDYKNIQGLLTSLAQVIVRSALNIVYQRLLSKYGRPTKNDGSECGFAILGMGSLGACEIDYTSDLDLAFVFEANGWTDGDRAISNPEFFTKLAQRFISAISIASRYGKAYDIDSELRPSGNSGSLITSFDAFIDYHSRTSQLWERMALMRARIIAGDDQFIETLRPKLAELAFLSDLPEDEAIRAGIISLCERVFAERSRESSSTLDIKFGPGGITNIDSIVQYHQLIHAAKLPSLRIQNTSEIINALSAAGIIDLDSADELRTALIFYRLIISRIRLITGIASHAIATESAAASQIAESLNLRDGEELISKLKEHRSAIKDITAHLLLK